MREKCLESQESLAVIFFFFILFFFNFWINLFCLYFLKTQKLLPVDLKLQPTGSSESDIFFNFLASQKLFPLCCNLKNINKKMTNIKKFTK